MTIRPWENWPSYYKQVDVVNPNGGHSTIWIDSSRAKLNATVVVHMGRHVGEEITVTIKRVYDTEVEGTKLVSHYNDARDNPNIMWD